MTSVMKMLLVVLSLQCTGIVAVAGIPEARINLNFAFFTSCFWLALAGYHLHPFCHLQYYNSFFCSCRVIELLAAAGQSFIQDLCNAYPLSDILAAINQFPLCLYL
jgi:hypothetical protein